MSLAVILLVLVVLPNFLSAYWVTLLTEILIYGLFAASINILVGYTGLPSLGHAAFFGTGAYTIAILQVKFGTGHGPSFLAGILAVFIVSALFALLAIRARGTYFLMITLALAQSLWAIAWRWISMSGGNDGLPGISRPDWGLSPWSLSSAHGFYFLVLAFLLLVGPALYLIIQSPFGQSLVGIRENEVRMKALGYHVWWHVFLGFLISGFFAGLSGILFAWYNGLVYPETLGATLSTEGLLMVLLGGGGTWWGPFLGAAAITILKHTLSSVTIHWLLVMGVIYIVSIIYMPQGIMGKWGRR